MIEIRLTYRALSELEKIEADSISQFGQVVTDKYISDIEDILQTISEYRVKSHKGT